jgi:hypothetical protein
MSRARTLADQFNSDGDLALTPVASVNAGQIGGRRNLIINGAMQVAQRGASETGVSTSQYANACDRFKLNGNNGTWTISQDTDAPDGFSNSFKMLLTATETIGSTSYWAVEQKIEGQNLQGLAYGTSSAETVTLSFYVKSNITGTYTVNLYQEDGSLNFPKTYTIDSAGTWERKTISFAGNTSTALDNDNASSLRTTFFVVAGSGVNSGTPGSRVAYSDATWAAGQSAQVDSVNDYWQITGVQLEVGDTATPFEHRSFGDELASCQRYYYRIGDAGGGFYATGYISDADDIYFGLSLPCSMRIDNPTISYANVVLYTTAGTETSYTINNFKASGASLYLNFDSTTSPWTAGQASSLFVTANTGFLAADGEL